MYLNIVNNSFFENRRNKKKEVLYKTKENTGENTSKKDFQQMNTETFEEKTFLSIFYGELTTNWLSINRN